MSDSEALSMFFEEDFVPHAYLDALFQASLDESPGAAATPAGLKMLQAKSTALIAHLEFYSNELNRDLETQISGLTTSASSVISYNTQANDLVGTTRLEYYLETMANAVYTLGDNMAEVARTIAALGDASHSAADTDVLRQITQLQTAKANMLCVQNVFAVLRSIVAENLPETVAARVPTSIKDNTRHEALTVARVNEAMNALEQSVAQQLASAVDPAAVAQVVAQINMILDVEHVFDGFDANGLSGSFRGFIGTLKHLKGRYVKS